MSPFVLVLILGFAVAQVVRLWRDDEITAPLRDRLDTWLDPIPKESHWIESARFWVIDLLDCPWCLSGWLSILFVAGVDLLTDISVPLPAILWLAVWRVAVFAYWLVEYLADADQAKVKPKPLSVNVTTKGDQ